MTFEIMRSYELQAAHRLPFVPAGHKCGRMHGHTWKVEVWVAGELDDDRGWFMDFAEIDEVYNRFVHRKLDHTCLNDTIENPTTEQLVCWIAGQLRQSLPGLSRIIARENDHSCVCMQVTPVPDASSTNSSGTDGES